MHLYGECGILYIDKYVCRIGDDYEDANFFKFYVSGGMQQTN